MRIRFGVFSALGTITASASMIALVSYGFRLGWVQPLRIVVDYYEALMHFLFGWAEPPLRFVLSYLSQCFGWKLHLYPHWKHVFILLWLYFSCISKAAVDEDGERLWLPTLFSIIGGFLIALVAGIAAGATNLVAESGPWYGSGFIAILPFGAIVLFWFMWALLSSFFFGEPLLKRLSGLVATIFVTLFVPTALAIVFSARPDWFDKVVSSFVPATSRSLVVLLTFTVTLALSSFLARYTSLISPDIDDGDRKVFARTAVLMSWAIVGTVTFVGANAGLKLVGL